MSRLILEGDTTERFGVKYPKPYIEKIEVQDAAIIPHVYVYLQVEEEVSDILQVQSLISNLNIVYIFGDTYATDDLEILDFEFVYSSGGVKYAKIKITGVSLGAGLAVTDIGYTEISQITEPIYFGAFTFAKDQNTLYKAPEPTTFDKSGVYKRYEAVASQLSYELVINSDGTPADEVIAYLQTDGNYFGSIPLQSLDRVFRTTENVSHRQVINSVNNVIAPYVGNLTEADNISLILNEYSDNPRLMLELKKEINSFSSKSSSTVTGQLYGSLVDVVGDLNSVLEASPRLQKRLVKNSKIIDQRSTAAAPYSAEGVYEDGSEQMPDYARYVSSPDRDSNFLYIGGYNLMSSRRVAPLISLSGLGEEELGNIDNYCCINDTYVFFDYEKALSYTSQLARHLNIYSIQDIFGKNCLNKYFTFRNEETDSVTVEKFSYTYGGKFKKRVLGFGGSLAKIRRQPYFQPQITNETFVDYELKSKKIYDGVSNGEEYYSKVVPRALYIGDQDYRLMCFYITDIEKLRNVFQPTYYRFVIRLDDRTMRFYNDIRRKLDRINTKLLEYQQFAQEFCSFNNISGKFNDFFIDSIRGQFSEPYPWEEAPLYMASLEALLISSYGSLDVPFVFDNRQDPRQPLDLEFIKEIATIQSRHIAPETGDLEQLNDFVDNKFSQLLEYFGRGTGLDASNEIYDQDPDLSDAAALKMPWIVQTFENEEFELPRNIINSYYEEYIAPEEEEIVEAPSGRITRWSGNEYDWNEEKTRRFVESRIIALMGTRGLKNNNPNDYTNNTLETLKRAMDATNGLHPNDVFVDNDSNAEGYTTAQGAAAAAAAAAAGAATAAGAGAAGAGLGTLAAGLAASDDGGDPSGRASINFAERATRIFLYIEQLANRLEPISQGNRNFAQRKNVIEQKMNFLKNKTGSNEEIVSGWNNNDKAYVEEQYPIFGNIGLYLIKCNKVLGNPSVVSDVIAGIRRELRFQLQE